MMIEGVGDGTLVSVAHRLLLPDAASHPAAKRWSSRTREGSPQVLTIFAALASRSEKTDTLGKQCH